MFKYLVLFLNIIVFSLLIFIFFMLMTNFRIELVGRSFFIFIITLSDSDWFLLYILGLIILFLVSISCALRN